jgi:multiple sugar transport system substrate-binding protein
VLEDPRFKSLPHRADIAPLAAIGRQLPPYVERQSAIEGIIGEEAAAAYTGQKGVTKALADAEHRVDDMLARLN